MLFVLSFLVNAGARSLIVPIVAFVVGAGLIAVFIAAKKAPTAPPVVKAVGEPLARHPVVFAGWCGVLIVGGALGIVMNRARVQTAREDRELCVQRIAEMGALNGPLPLGEATKLRGRAEEGREACDAAGLAKEAHALAAAMAEIDRQVASAQKQLREAQPAATSGIDPASCPRGRVMIDATGKAIHCTGEVTAGPVPPFVTTLAALAGNPKAVKPKKVERDRKNGEDSYEYTFAPFSEVTLIIYDGTAARWTFDLKGRSFTGEDLGPRGAVKKMCQKGVARFKTLAQWYRIDGGPLAGAYAATWEPDASTIGAMILSADETRAEMEHEVTLGLARPPSLDKYVCPDGG
jgi:hypothetical protein